MKKISIWIFECEFDQYFTPQEEDALIIRNAYLFTKKKSLINTLKGCACEKGDCKPVKVTIQMEKEF